MKKASNAFLPPLKTIENRNLFAKGGGGRHLSSVLNPQSNFPSRIYPVTE